jgi:Spy/CpxP family protein refolding chaperone
MKYAFIVTTGLLFTVSLLAAESPYAGEEQRRISAFSASEIAALEHGDGMGFAKAAELNHYPGPKHVLELAEELELTPSQRAGTESIYADMRSRARQLGRELLEAEAALDRAFAEKTFDAAALEIAVLRIGELRARLRYVHLAAHLRQADILSAAQIAKYDRLRGYTGHGHDPAMHSGHHE